MSDDGRRLCYVRLTSEGDFLANQDLMTPGQRALYRYAQFKRGNWKYPEPYLQNARFLIYSEPGMEQAYCSCGAPNPMNRTGHCQFKRYCPRCAEYEGWNACKKLENVFYRGNYYFVTLSFRGQVNFDRDKYLLTTYWDACRYAMKKLVEEKLIRGGVSSEELAVVYFLPTEVLPHVHAVIDADDFTENMKAKLEEEMDAYLASYIEEGRLKASVEVSAIESETDFENRIGYLFKPMILGERYDDAWVLRVDGDPMKATRLNSDVKDLILGLGEILKGGKNVSRKTVKWFGNFHASNKESIIAARNANQRGGRRRSPRNSRQIVPRQPRSGWNWDVCLAE